MKQQFTVRRGGSSSDGLRARLLYFVLFPAIVIAVLVLGGLSLRTALQIEKARQQTILDTTATLATERVELLDNQIVSQDNVVVAHTDLTDLTSLSRRWLATAARETPTVRAILVIDASSDEKEVIAYASKNPGKQDDVFRRLLLQRLIRTMNLAGRAEELRHLHEAVDDAQYLLSYWQRIKGNRRYLMVAWHDVDRITKDLMPQLYRDPDRGNARMNVIDERGRIVFGPPIKVGEFTVGKRFPTTLYNWQLQLAIPSAEEVTQKAVRKRLLELSLVIVAGVVAIAGLFIMIRASIEERRLAHTKSEFVANVSHELKTPLSLIRMFGELLYLDRVKDEAKKKRYYQILVGEAERLTALIENVLDFARVERGKAVYEFVEGDVGEAVARAAEIYRYRAETESTNVSIKIDPSLPLVKLDVRAIELAIMNLIDNALKYAKDGGEVVISSYVEGKWVCVDVRDRGPGIPEEERARIFERFFRGEAARASHTRGSGIGLSLVDHIASSHGGDVCVESPAWPDGRGVAFVLRLPIARSQKPSTSPAARKTARNVPGQAVSDPAVHDGPHTGQNPATTEEPKPD